MRTDKETRDYWRQRGILDAKKGKGPLFRETRARGVYGVGEADLPWDRETEIEIGRAYLSGYGAREEE